MTVDIAEAQQRLPKWIRAKQTVSLRKDSETVAFLLPRERMEALMETRWPTRCSLRVR